VGQLATTFSEFLDVEGLDGRAELIDGVIVERSTVQLDHEKLLRWLERVLGLYAGSTLVGQP
jgi:Uma2 family endonuclease